MKKFLVIAVISAFLVSSSEAYAGEAWPWIVGGLAGAALLSTAAHSHSSSYNTTYVHHYPTPGYQTTTYVAPAGYNPYWQPYVRDVYIYPACSGPYSGYGVSYYGY